MKRLLLLLLLTSTLVACGESALPDELTTPPGEITEPQVPDPDASDPDEPEQDAPDSDTSEPAQPSTGLSEDLETLLELVNEVRAEGASCGGSVEAPAPPLKLEPRLTVAAQKHSEDMAGARTMSHDTPSGAVHYSPGSSPWDRMAVEGYAYGAAGENVAAGYRSAEAVMQGWLGSTGHCNNIMNPNFTELGLGLEDNYWTQKFARPR